MYLLSGEYMLDRLSGWDKLDLAYIYLTQFGADLFMINADNKKVSWFTQVYIQN